MTFLAPWMLFGAMAAGVPIALHLARWGDPLGRELSWLDPPPQAALAEARQVLSQLGAISPDGALTVHGRQLGELGPHPRLGALGGSGGQRGAACPCGVERPAGGPR